MFRSAEQEFSIFDDGFSIHHQRGPADDTVKMKFASQLAPDSDIIPEGQVDRSYYFFILSGAADEVGLGVGPQGKFAEIG